MKIIAKPEGCIRVYQQNLLGYYNEQQKRRNKYFDRMALLISTISKIKPDIAIFEECMPDYAVLETILKALGPDYRAVCAYTNIKKFHQVVILTHLPQESVEKVNLRADKHNGIHVTLLYGNTRIGIGALHSTWKPAMEIHRMVQGTYLRKALKDYSYAIIAGDFNMVPFGPSVQEFYQNGYRSAYKEVHNREAPSFPTKYGKTLYTGLYATLQSFVSTISGNGKRGSYCLDYIFTRGFIARNCQMVTSNDPSLDISDHAGVVADLYIDSKV
jgi:endonuclease/exonuclease/phosphatase family metal-dependent hydrolase